MIIAGRMEQGHTSKLTHIVCFLRISTQVKSGHLLRVFGFWGFWFDCAIIETLIFVDKKVHQLLNALTMIAPHRT